MKNGNFKDFFQDIYECLDPNKEIRGYMYILGREKVDRFQTLKVKFHDL